MVYEKTQTYEIQDKKLENFQIIIEDLMIQSLKMEARSAKIDDSLTIITFLDSKKDKNLQKENKIAIYQEGQNIYVQVKGEFTDNEADTFWIELEKRLKEPIAISEKKADNDKELKQLGSLSENEIAELKLIIKDIPPDKKQFIFERLKDIETDLKDLANKGITLTELEKQKFRISVLKKKKADRKAMLKQVIKEKKGLTVGEIIHLIIINIQNQGYLVDYSEVNEFIENFQEEYNRLPLKEEIPSIANGYIKMKAVEKKVEPPVEKPIPIIEPLPEPAPAQVEVSPTDALIEIVRDYSFLTESEKTYFVNLILEKDIENQKKIAANLEYIEKMIGNNYDLDNFEKVDLRKQLAVLKRNEISMRIDEILSQKRAEEESLGWIPEKQLRKLGFLSEANITVILRMIEKLPEERQREVIDRLKEIEQEFDDLVEDGVNLTNWEREQYRTDLVKLTPKNRKERLMELTQDKKQEIVTEKLYEEIPQLRFEDNKKLIKELIWLNKEELDQRIKKLKEKIEKKLEKKQELFEKSSAGTTCPECGWPVGSFSKKCPRCGRKLIDWM